MIESDVQPLSYDTQAGGWDFEGYYFYDDMEAA